MNKQTGSIGKALKPVVFLVGSKFRLRISFGKPVRFPNPSATWKLLCLFSEAVYESRLLFFVPQKQYFMSKKGNESFYFAVCDVLKKSGAKNVPIFSKNTKYTLVQRGNLGYS